jgi:uncharacterized membrane protein
MPVAEGQEPDTGSAVDGEKVTSGSLSLRRLERLSDVVYAAALLILLATMTFAGGEPSTSEDAWIFLTTEFEAWISFVISFLIIAYYWITHQVYFSYYRRTDKAHTFLELIYLMFLAVMPLGNQFVGAHADLFEAKLIASADIVAVGVMQYFTWAYATGKDRLVEPGVPDAATRSALAKEALVLPAAAVIGAIAAYFYAYLWEVVLIIGPLVATTRSKPE